MGIFGSNAAGECMPPHWQLPTTVMVAKRENIKLLFLCHIQNTRGKFGYKEEKIWPATTCMNKKGGMRDVKFERYVENSIKPLFPDLEDTPGQCMPLKVDSVLGWNCKELLAKCKFSGVYIYPGLLNATAVQQETDQNYGPFKSVVQDAGES
jgi:hypothetical protein